MFENDPWLMALLQQQAMAGGASMMPPPEGFGASPAPQGLLGMAPQGGLWGMAPQQNVEQRFPSPAPQGMPQPVETRQIGTRASPSAGVEPAGPSTDAFQQQALAEQGGIDPRAMENGTADFSSPWEQARLMGAKAQGFARSPQGSAALMGAGAGLLSQQPRQPAPSAGPRPQSNAPIWSSAEIMQKLKQYQSQHGNFAGLLGQAYGGR